MQAIVSIGLVLILVFMVCFLLAGFGVINLDEIRYRPHALIQHGEAANAARNAVRNCGQGLQAYDCPSTLTKSDSYLFICPLDSTGITCAGMYVGTRGAELTSWIMPCAKWYGKATSCIVH